MKKSITIFTTFFCFSNFIIPVYSMETTEINAPATASQILNVTEKMTAHHLQTSHHLPEQQSYTKASDPFKLCADAQAADQKKIYDGIMFFLNYVLEMRPNSKLGIRPKSKVVSKNKEGRNSLTGLLLCTERSAMKNNEFAIWLRFFGAHAFKTAASFKVSDTTKTRLLEVFIKKIELFYSIDHENASQFLNPLVEKYIKKLNYLDGAFTMSFDWRSFFIIHALQSMKRLDPLNFEKYASTLLQNNLVDLVAFILAFPQQMENFDGTALSIPTIFKHVLNDAPEINIYLSRLLQEQKYSELLAKYKDDIAKLVANEPINGTQYSIVAKLIHSPSEPIHNKKYLIVLQFIQSSIKELQTAGLQACVNYLAALMRQRPQNSKLIKKELEKFMVHISQLFIQEVDEVDDDSEEIVFCVPLAHSENIINALNDLYQHVRENNAYDALLYLLWCLEDSDDANIQAFLKKILCEFFAIQNLPAEKKLSVNEIFDLAIQQQTIPFERGLGIINAIKKIPKKNLFCLGSIDELANKYKLSCLGRDNIPVAEKCIFLSEIVEFIYFSTMHEPETRGDKYAEIVQHISSLPTTPFKEWAILVMQAWNSETLPEYLEKQKLIKQLCDEHHELSPNVSVLNYWSWGPFNGILEYEDKFGQDHSECAVMTEGLYSAKLDNNMIFGFRRYQKNNQQIAILYAFDSNDGHFLWAVPINIQKDMPRFVVSDHFVCVLDEEQKITQIDKRSGCIKKEFFICRTNEMQRIFITSDDVLFVVQGGRWTDEHEKAHKTNPKVRIVNLNDTTIGQSHNFMVVNLPIDLHDFDCFMDDNELVFNDKDEKYQSKKRIIINKNGSMKQITFNENIEFFHKISPNLFVCWASGDQKIKFIDDNGQIIFEYIAPASVKYLKLSPDRKQLYILMYEKTSDEENFANEKMIALDISSIPTQATPLLWEINMSQHNIGGTVIYDETMIGYSKDDKVFSIDFKTGAIKYLLSLDDQYRNREYAFGVHNKKLYLSRS